MVLFTLQLRDMRDVVHMPFWSSLGEEGYFNISSGMHKPGNPFTAQSSHMIIPCNFIRKIECKYLTTLRSVYNNWAGVLLLLFCTYTKMARYVKN